MARRPKATYNPAQRLYDILERHSEEVPKVPNRGYAATWAVVFGVKVDVVAEYIAEAFGLVSEIDRAFAATRDASQREVFDHHKDAWTRAFVPGSSGWHQVPNDGVASKSSRVALGGIASNLRSESPEGRMPDEAQQKNLSELIHQAIEAVTNDETLDDRIAQVILLRLYEIAWALDHIKLKGPDGIAAACDRLVVAIATAGQDLPPEGSPQETDGHRSRRALLNLVSKVAATANDIIQMPGAWYGTSQAIMVLAPHAANITHQITGH